MNEIGSERMIGQKRTRIGGFQNKGKTRYVQEIIRRTEGPDGLGYHPPSLGDSIITRSGPFVVEEINKIFEIPGKKRPRRFFEAEGKLRKRFSS